MLCYYPFGFFFETSQKSEVNSKFSFQKSVVNIIMHHYCYNCKAFILINLVLFAVSVYHFLFSKYLDLTKCHFSSDVLVPFPDSSDLYSHAWKFDFFYESTPGISTCSLQIWCPHPHVAMPPTAFLLIRMQQFWKNFSELLHSY